MTKRRAFLGRTLASIAGVLTLPRFLTAERVPATPASPLVAWWYSPKRNQCGMIRVAHIETFVRGGLPPVEMISDTEAQKFGTKLRDVDIGYYLPNVLVLRTYEDVYRHEVILELVQHYESRILIL